MSTGSHGDHPRGNPAEGGAGDRPNQDLLAVVAEASQALLTTDAAVALRRIADALVTLRQAAHAVILTHEEPGPRLYVEAGRASAYGTASVPLVLDHHVVGSLSADALPPPHGDVERLTFLLKTLAPLIVDGLAAQRARHVDRRQLIEENERLRRRHEHFDPMALIGESGAMRPVADGIAHAAASDAPILLRGEPGAGKELIARAIHQRSGWSDRPFVEVSGAALHVPAMDADVLTRMSLVAPAARRGPSKALASVARGGTLYIDEVADLTPSGQDRLLRLLQDPESQTRPPGTPAARIRIMASTAVNLEQAVASGTLRGEVYHHLYLHTIVIPPLRERDGDIPVLANLFLDRFAREYSKTVARLSDRVIDLLLRYPWPGNVRELVNAMERAVILSEDGVIHGHHLPPAIRMASGANAGEFSLSDALDAYEKELLQDALRTAGGVRSRAARLLKTTERIFNYKVRKHGIDSSHYKPPGT
jgi:Nif-specific regulatory protein